MSQILTRLDMIPHSLLQNLRLRKSSLSFAVPDEDFLYLHVISIRSDAFSFLGFLGQVHGEEAAGCGYEGDFTDAAAEC